MLSLPGDRGGDWRSEEGETNQPSRLPDPLHRAALIYRSREGVVRRCARARCSTSSSAPAPRPASMFEDLQGMVSGLRPPVRSEGSPVTATPASPRPSSRCSITGALCSASPDPPPPFRLQVQFPLRFTSSPRKKTQLFSHGAATTAALNTAKQMRCARFSTVNVS
jgi:hypothetical protein